ncbi:hypothetical protein [Arenibaculum pallidiluteum]|uniref:hypothetical protein n=1 Tax=Arenibaculum pallidiluteum TaxID=2812559 RepID=UPI001A95B76C|nr:hypothetical protein [Arenibaculum pallidiluteum]
MRRDLALSIMALGLAAATPAQAQDARACTNEVQRLSTAFLAPGKGLRPQGGGEQPAATTDVPSPSATSEAREIARSGGEISTSPTGDRTRHGDRRGTEPRPAAGPPEHQPGARKGTSFTEEDRRRIEEAVREARAAGERGDGAGCVRRLAEARQMIRQAGIGSGRGGMALGGGSGGQATGTPGAVQSAPGGLAGTSGSRSGAATGATQTPGVAAGPAGTPGAAAGGSLGGGSMGSTSGGSMGGAAGGGAAGGGTSGSSSGGSSGGGGGSQ